MSFFYPIVELKYPKFVGQIRRWKQHEQNSGKHQMVYKPIHTNLVTNDVEMLSAHEDDNVEPLDQLISHMLEAPIQ